MCKRRNVSQLLDPAMLYVWPKLTVRLRLRLQGEDQEIPFASLNQIRTKGIQPPHSLCLIVAKWVAPSIY